MNELYPGITRKIYINAYRYSLHMKDKSMLIELGAQTNTIDEVYNTIDMLAETINCVVG
jgi:stage II sporulation protein P